MEWLLIAVLASLSGGYGAASSPPAPDSRKYISGGFCAAFVDAASGLDGTKTTGALAMALGWREPFGLSRTRTEAEVSFSVFQIDSFRAYYEYDIVDAKNFSSITHEGLNIIGLSWNWYYEFPITEIVRPYAGIGLGVMMASSPREDRRQAGNSASTNMDHSYAAVRFVPEYIIGLEFRLHPLDSGRQMSIGAEYRFMDTNFGFTHVSAHTILGKINFKI